MLVSLLAALPALADDAAKPAFPVITPSALIFAHYGLDLTEDHYDLNSFDLDRAYFTLNGQITKNLGAKITLDAGRPDGTALYVFVKNAYMEGKDFAPGLKMRFGIVDTGYLTYSEQFFGHRYLFKTMGDEQKIGSTADAGFNISGEHLGGLISWHAAAINGEGYKSVELDQSKTLQARLTIDPLAKGGKMNLPITGYISDDVTADICDAQGKPDGCTTTPGKLWYAAGVGFKYKPYVTFWGEYLGGTQNAADDADKVNFGGFSLQLAAGKPEYADLVARFDQFDPNTDKDSDKDAKTSLKVGAEHFFADKVAVAVMYERSWAEGDADADPEIPPTQGIFVRAQAGF